MFKISYYIRTVAVARECGTVLAHSVRSGLSSRHSWSSSLSACKSQSSPLRERKGKGRTRGCDSVGARIHFEAKTPIVTSVHVSPHVMCSSPNISLSPQCLADTLALALPASACLQIQLFSQQTLWAIYSLIPLCDTWLNVLYDYKTHS